MDFIIVINKCFNNFSVLISNTILFNPHKQMLFGILNIFEECKGEHLSILCCLSMRFRSKKFPNFRIYNICKHYLCERCEIGFRWMEESSPGNSSDVSNRTMCFDVLKHIKTNVTRDNCALLTPDNTRLHWNCSSLPFCSF